MTDTDVPWKSVARCKLSRPCVLPLAPLVLFLLFYFSFLLPLFVLRASWEYVFHMKIICYRIHLRQDL